MAKICVIPIFIIGLLFTGLECLSQGIFQPYTEESLEERSHTVESHQFQPVNAVTYDGPKKCIKVFNQTTQCNPTDCQTLCAPYPEGNGFCMRMDPNKCFCIWKCVPGK
ncbi:uncharacterized protein LOC130717539 [Lotus japonicus]|uniref:uncharacterized protein LOC130717539 n=1 Tax=Lotus japonicus TaxID=34305 RepID=UPI00258DEC0B|nr:uncharacterized protein LOC130717539 [Lotus japonicus]